MTPFGKWLVHEIAGLGGITASFTFIPHPYDLWAAAIWAGIVTTSAFLDKSVANNQL